MKSLKNRLIISAGLSLCTSILVSCGPGEPGTWKNEKIKSSVRDEFRQRNGDLFKLLKQDDQGALKNYESEEMIEDGGTTRMIERINNHLRSEDYALFDEYYIVNKLKGENKIPSGSNDVNKYTIAYNASNQEMYVAFYLPKKGDNKWMVTTVWSKYNYGWKLSLLDLDKYTINGKTAPELLEFAKQQYQKKYLVNAVNSISLAARCSSPSSIWRYDKTSEIDSLNAAFTTEANSKITFPCTLASLPSQPKIVSIYNQDDAGNGYYPAIYYITKIKLSDTAAIKRENDGIKKIIGKTIPGIDKDKKRIFYSAFNEMPSAVRSVPHFDMVQKLE